jgi:hypothetical protein
MDTYLDPYIDHRSIVTSSQGGQRILDSGFTKDPDLINWRRQPAVTPPAPYFPAAWSSVLITPVNKDTAICVTSPSPDIILFIVRGDDAPWLCDPGGLWLTQG